MGASHAGVAGGDDSSYYPRRDVTGWRRSQNNDWARRFVSV